MEGVRICGVWWGGAITQPEVVAKPGGGGGGAGVGVGTYTTNMYARTHTHAHRQTDTYPSHPPLTKCEHPCVHVHAEPAVCECVCVRMCVVCVCVCAFVCVLDAYMCVYVCMSVRCVFV